MSRRQRPSSRQLITGEFGDDAPDTDYSNSLILDNHFWSRFRIVFAILFRTRVELSNIGLLKRLISGSNKGSWVKKSLQNVIFLVL